MEREVYSSLVTLIVLDVDSSSSALSVVVALLPYGGNVTIPACQLPNRPNDRLICE